MKSANWISAIGPQAVDGGADRGADDHRLGQRRVDHPLVAELGPQAVGREEHAALLADVLAEHDRSSSSRRISSARVSRIASMNVLAPASGLSPPVVLGGVTAGGAEAPRRRRLAGPALGEHPVHRGRRVRVGLRLGVLGRVVDGGLDLGRDRRLELVGQDARVAQLRRGSAAAGRASFSAPAPPRSGTSSAGRRDEWPSGA